MNNLSDKQLLELLRGGYSQTYKFLYDELNEEIYKFLFDTCPNKEWAEELTGETFMRAWDLRKRVKSRNHLLACLYLIARQLFLQRLVGATPAEVALRKLASEAQRRELMNEYLDITVNQILVRLDAAMRSLPHQRKQVLKMLVIEGRNTDTVALTLGIETQTVRNTKTDAVDSLVKELHDRDLFRPAILRALLVYLEQG